MVSDIIQLIEKDPVNPPKIWEVGKQIPGSDKVVHFMLQQNMLVELPDNIIIQKKRYHEIEREIVNFLEKKGEISIQDMHSLFGFSRKYVIPLLSYLDIKGITRREGNMRILAKKPR